MSLPLTPHWIPWNQLTHQTLNIHQESAPQDHVRLRVRSRRKERLDLTATPDCARPMSTVGAPQQQFAEEGKQ